MAPRVDQGKVIYRLWAKGKGLEESEKAFRSLDELFELCVSAENPDLVDRIVLEGNDQQGSRRTLVFTFQSSTGLED